MGCHIKIAQSGPWKGAQVIACGEAFEPPKSCKFCGDSGLYLCDWKVERVEDVHWHDVRIGDTWALQGPGANVTARVAAIEPEQTGLRFFLDTGKTVLTPFRFLNSTMSCPILRPGTCDQPMCERHAREVGDDVHYCMDCWQRQRALIGGAQ